MNQNIVQTVFVKFKGVRKRSINKHLPLINIITERLTKRWTANMMGEWKNASNGATLSLFWGLYAWHSDDTDPRFFFFTDYLSGLKQKPIKTSTPHRCDKATLRRSVANVLLKTLRLIEVTFLTFTTKHPARVKIIKYI